MAELLVYLGEEICLKNFDTILGVGIGVNLALTVLKGIKETISKYLLEKVKIESANLNIRIESLVAQNMLTTEAATKFENKLNSTGMNNPRVERLLLFWTIFFALITALIFLYELYIAANNPSLIIHRWQGVVITLSVFFPILFFSLATLAIGYKPLRKVIKGLKTMDGVCDILSSKSPIDPPQPKV